MSSAWFSRRTVSASRVRALDGRAPFAPPMLAPRPPAPARQCAHRDMGLWQALRSVGGAGGGSCAAGGGLLLDKKTVF